MPWDLARPAQGQPTLYERNMRMVFKHAKSVPAAACLPRLPHQPLRVLMIFSDVAQGLPDALRQERRALMALFARQVFPHRQAVLYTLAHRLARSQLVAYLREHDGFHILHFSLYGSAQDVSGQLRHSALPHETDWADWFREAGVGLPQLVYLAHGVGNEQATQRNWRDFFATGQSALPPPAANGPN